METKNNNPPKQEVKAAPAPVKDQPKSSKSSTCLIIVVIVFVLGFFVTLILGFFGWKFYSNWKKNIKSKIFPTSFPLKIFPSPTPFSPTTSLSPTVTLRITPTLAVIPDFIIPESNIREVTEEELRVFTPWQLKVARNEIYARYGRSFVHQDLACYFATKSWYVKNPSFSSSQLSLLDNKNVATILAYEQEINSPVLNFDSGCQQ